MSQVRCLSIRKSLFTFLIISILMFFGSMAGAKDISRQLVVPEADESQILTLQGGSQLIGRISEIGDESITFVSQLGETKITIDRIVDIKLIPKSAMHGEEYWFPNPNSTRLLLAPTGRMLKAGTGYFSDIYIFFPFVGYGITDNITISGGMSLFPGVDISNQLLYINPKIGFKINEDWHIAVSALIFRFPDIGDFDDVDIDDDPIEIGVLFGTATLGDENKSLTGGLGFGYAEGDIANKPAVLLGGEYRFNRRLAFVSENWVFPEVDEPLLSYGLRFFGESIAVDLAFFTVLGDDAIFPGIPFIDFVWNF